MVTRTIGVAELRGETSPIEGSLLPVELAVRALPPLRDIDPEADRAEADLSSEPARLSVRLE